jgi:predicted AAA+ superfamily ATPase
MLDDVISDDTEMGVMVETTVYKHIITFYQSAPSVHTGYYRKAKENQKEVDIVIELPQGKILCEVKYKNNTSVPAADAIITLSKEEDTKVVYSFIVTKSLLDYGMANHQTLIPVFRVPALIFVYLLGRIQAMGGAAKI